jgi:hypothetical protein
MMNSIKAASPRLTIRKAATAASTQQSTASISNAAMVAAVATNPAAIASARSIPKATPVPYVPRSVSPDPTIDYAGRSKVVSRTVRIPTDATLSFLTQFDIRYMLPGIGAGAGGELERTLSFSVLYDNEAEVMLIHMRVTGAYLTVHYPDHFTVRDLVHTFFRNKPITLCNLPSERLDMRLADLVLPPRTLNWSLRAY